MGELFDLSVLEEPHTLRGTSLALRDRAARHFADGVQLA